MDPNVPGSSNAPAHTDPFARNPDGTVPADAVVPADPTHVASVQPKPDASKDEPKK